jgi:hypothetical protein
MSFAIIGTKPCKKLPLCHNQVGHCQIYQINQLALSRDTQSAPKGENCLMTAFVHFRNWSVESVIGVL